MSAADWYVYDPEFIDQDGGPVLIGPFARRDEAEEYANLLHPDDDTEVLKAVAP